MSSASKIVIAIIIGAVIIAGAVMWSNQDGDDNRVSNTNTEMDANNDVLPTPPAAPLVNSVNPQPNTPPPPEVMSFEASIPTTSWVLWRVTLDNKTANLNINVPAPLTLQFDTKAKKVAGFSGCNNFSGSYSTIGTENSLSFGALLSTKKGCPETLELESIIAQAMSKVTNYGIKGNQLVLSNNDSSTEIVYNQAK